MSDDELAITARLPPARLELLACEAQALEGRARLWKDALRCGAVPGSQGLRLVELIGAAESRLREARAHLKATRQRRPPHPHPIAGDTIPFLPSERTHDHLASD